MKSQKSIKRAPSVKPTDGPINKQQSLASKASSKPPKQKQQQRGKKQGGSQQQQVRQKQPSAVPAKKQPVKITNQCVEMVLDCQTLAPQDPTLTLVRVIQDCRLEDERLVALYARLLTSGDKLVIRPLVIDRSAKPYRIVCNVEGLKKYTDMQLQLQEKFVWSYLIQVLYSLHPSTLKWQQQIFPKLAKQNIYIVDSPWLQHIVLRDEKYGWVNIMRVMITGTVKDEKQYYQQIGVFDEGMPEITSYEQLRKLCQDYKYGKYRDQVYGIDGVAAKISNQLQDKKIEEGVGAPNEEIEWVAKQVGLADKYKPYLAYTASSCNYQPAKFWQKVRSTQKSDHSSQLLVLQIETQAGKQKLVGVCSPVLQASLTSGCPQICQYIPDNSKDSLLINLSQRTLHHLNDPRYAVGYSRDVLLCVGKCDIVVSAYNFASLCYFPTTYDPDNDHLCSNKDALCGGKNFVLKELFLYRFAKVGDPK